MSIRTFLLIIAAFVTCSVTSQTQHKVDYKNDTTYLRLSDAMRHAFNDGDSIRFFPALKNLEDYLLKQGDLHGYYTQRCNEIVFEMNRRRIFEAYMLGRKLSMELTEKNLEKEMYMAYNMLGHINRICGNKKAAKRNFYKVIDMMEEQGYYESMPPIYMNIVNVAIDDDHDEALRLLDKAKEIAEKYSPERVFDIETRRTVSYFNNSDIPKFLEGYKVYKEGVKEGRSSVHGRTMEVYYLAATGETDKAVELARKELGDDSDDIVTMIYEKAGRWKEAYTALRKAFNTNDSVNNVALANSMMGIRDQLAINDIENRSVRNRTIAMAVGIVLLGLLVAALSYIVITRRKHVKAIKEAYEHALESDKMKTAFIQNVSHEVRTPLNIISGFAQVLSAPDFDAGMEERQNMARMMLKNTHQITSLIDEMLELSINESSKTVIKDDEVELNDMLRDLLQENHSLVNSGVQMHFESTLSDDYTILTNQLMLKRLLSVLMDNATKYTEQGSITLKATTDGQQLLVSVEDTGCGIPVEEAEHVFERFVKLDAFKEGIGLGLPLCRTIAIRMGGMVRLDTTYKGPGSRFIVTLPL